MEQFSELGPEEESDEALEEDEAEEPVNPMQLEAEAKVRLDYLEGSILKNLKYVKKSGHKPTLRKLQYKHWKHVLKILMTMEVLQDIISHPGYKNVRSIAQAMLQQLKQTNVKKNYIKKANHLIKVPVPGFSDGDLKTLSAKFEGAEGIQERIQTALKKRKKSDLLRSKLNSLGVIISDKLNRVLQVRESYLELKKNVLNQAKQRFKILNEKKQFMDACANRKKIRDYFLTGWKRELEKEWKEMGKQANKLNASKHVRRRLQEMKHRKWVMTIQLASLPPAVRRHLITTEVTKMFRDIKRNVEEIRNKKPSFETVMLRKVEKRKQRKLLKMAKKKLLLKEEENRLRSIRAKHKRKSVFVNKIKDLKSELKQTTDLLVQQVRPIIKSSDQSMPSIKSVGFPSRNLSQLTRGSVRSITDRSKNLTSSESVPVKLKDEGSFKLSVVPSSVCSSYDNYTGWRQKRSKQDDLSGDPQKSKGSRMKAPNYYANLMKKIENNEIVAKYTQRLQESIAGLKKASLDSTLPENYRQSLIEKADLLEQVLEKRKNISDKLDKESKHYEDFQEQMRLAKKWKRLKKQQEKEILALMEKDVVFDFPDDRKPLWSITGDGWSWTGYKVYTLDDLIHPWGFTQGFRERSPLQLGTAKFPASYSISGYSNFKDFTEHLKKYYIDILAKTAKSSISGVSKSVLSVGDRKTLSSLKKTKSNETTAGGLQALFWKIAQGIEVPHLPNRIPKPLPLPDSSDQEDLVPTESGPPAFPLKDELPKPEQTYGYKYAIRLQETDTITLFEKESNIIYLGSEEAEKAKKLDRFNIDNKLKRESFEMNVSDAFTQVVQKPQGHFASLMAAPERVSVGIYACMGEIQGSQSVEVQQEVDPNLAYLAALASSSSDDEKDNYPSTIVSSKAFFETTNSIERILSTNPHMNNLIAYQGALVPDPYGSVVDICSELVYLWTFKYPRKVKNRCVRRQSVSSIAWSDKIEAVIAVGYGSFFNTTHHYGLICIWNIKNLSIPERVMTYTAGVCHVEFSTKHPYILSCSFQDGFVAVYNIYPQVPSILCDNKKCTVHSGEPVWQVSWMTNNLREDVCVAGGQTGEFYAYAKQNFSRPNLLMAINRKEGKVVGFEDSHFVNPKLNSTPAITCFVPVPADKENFLVGTDDGSVRVISLFARNLQIDLFNAHRDKINRIEFSPFCPKLFFTVGGDFALRIWVYGLKSPILTLVSRDMYIEDAAWSPANPSLLVSIGGIYIDLWDLGRCGIGKPIATATNPKKRRNSCIRFSNNGRNIGVGDLWGDVHIFCLNKMPFDPLLPHEALLRSLSNALAFTPDVLNQVIKVGPPFDRMSNIVRKKENIEDVPVGKKDK